MADYDFVTPRLATGAAIGSSADVEALVAAGVTHVIDCIAGSDDALLLATHPAITYLYNGTEDDGQLKPPSWFARSLSFAMPALALPHNKVYAHCAAGCNRGPSTAFCIMRAQGFTHDDALNLIHTARPVTVNGVRYASDADAAIIALGYD